MVTNGTALLRETPKGRVRALIEAQLVDLQQLSIPELTTKVLQQVQADPAWTRALLKEALQPLVYEIVRRTVQNTRGLIVYGREIVSRDRFEELVTERASRFETWMEHCGNGHVRLMSATRVNLRVAAQERRNSAETDLTLAALWETIASLLPDDTTRVEDVLNAAQIAQLEASLQARSVITEGVHALVQRARAEVLHEPE